MMVTVPLIVDVESGVNDYLDRDGSRTPVQFHISNDHNQHPLRRKWCKRPPSGSAWR
jgi:aspartate--ammonia ligase